MFIAIQSFGFLPIVQIQCGQRTQIHVTKVSSLVMRLFQALAPFLVWAELGPVGRDRGKLPPQGVTLERAREHQRGRLWPRNLGENPASRNPGPNPHPRESGSSPARSLGSSRVSGGERREGEREYLSRRNTSTPFIRQSLPPGEQNTITDEGSTAIHSKTQKSGWMDEREPTQKAFPARVQVLAVLITTISGKAVLRVLNLNFWGIGWPLSSDKEVRWVLGVQKKVKHAGCRWVRRYLGPRGPL